MVEPLSAIEARRITEARRTAEAAPDPSQPAGITEQIARLIPLVNGRHGVARVDRGAALSGLPSLMSWDADGQLSID